MVRFFSSPKLTFILLLSLVLLLGLGTVFSLFPDLLDGIRLMNESLIQVWFFEALRTHWLLPIWFLVICVCSGLLFLNTLVCSVSKQLVTALKVSTPRRWAFFMIHIFFLMVLFCHGITLVSGEKVSNVQLFAGDSYESDTLTIRLNSLTFTDNSDFLKLGPKKSREVMTRKLFHRTANFADLLVVEKDRPPVSGRIMMLSPLCSGNLRVTLTRFVPGKEENRGEIGVNLTITRNGFIPFFFAMYAFMIISLVCFIAVTWNPQAKGDPTINPQPIKGER
ncbi:hypothetical protein HRM2_13480 [Desulforapulum autotrophicum HRM2]|uniref:ResB-like domain-containing protein n=1 Tax=Desulforapulum autotrophicum (strain ATCC 43914 / DSM 3382 / VKM B-1955 / HRM2) TaxID=177437 RepID=C0Q8W9_DESAH|nr:hypothetical protein [Desulforapulum autotrophicum]ACN14459.1 hypothetical protein HRM2_13480 [Desulforapulum autotrophicum HRM2]